MADSPARRRREKIAQCTVAAGSIVSSEKQCTLIILRLLQKSVSAAMLPHRQESRAGGNGRYKVRQPCGYHLRNSPVKSRLCSFRSTQYLLQLRDLAVRRPQRRASSGHHNADGTPSQPSSISTGSLLLCHWVDTHFAFLRLNTQFYQQPKLPMVAYRRGRLQPRG